MIIKDYLGSRIASERLTRKIKSYYAILNRDVNVWVEEEVLGATTIYNIRSNIIYNSPTKFS